MLHFSAATPSPAPAITALTCSANFAALSTASSCNVEPDAAPGEQVALKAQREISMAQRCPRFREKTLMNLKSLLILLGPLRSVSTCPKIRILDQLTNGTTVGNQVYQGLHSILQKLLTLCLNGATCCNLGGYLMVQSILASFFDAHVYKLY